MAETGQRSLAANGAVAQPQRVALRMQERFTSIVSQMAGPSSLAFWLARELRVFIEPDTATLHEKLPDVAEASGATQIDSFELTPLPHALVSL